MSAWDAHLGGDPEPEIVDLPTFDEELLAAARARTAGRGIIAVAHRTPYHASLDLALLDAALSGRDTVLLFPSAASAQATFDRVRRTIEKLAENDETPPANQEGLV